jgi:hypothetical protein
MHGNLKSCGSGNLGSGCIAQSGERCALSLEIPQYSGYNQKCIASSRARSNMALKANWPDASSPFFGSLAASRLAQRLAASQPKAVEHANIRTKAESTSKASILQSCSA